MRHLLTLLLILLALCVTDCSRSGEDAALDRAEALMEQHPDSALAVLRRVDTSGLGSDAGRARYALLMSMALDKNYIDTTTFDVLRPAIDYYLEDGTPDQKLRTYYYQGVIYLNQGNHDNALSSFTRALDNTHGITDSLCLARALVAQAILYQDFYDYAGYTDNCLRAADIYKSHNNKHLEFDCLLKALNGSIIVKDRLRADSILNICNKFTSLDDTQNQVFQGYRLAHAMIFGSKDEIKYLIDNQKSNVKYDTYGLINLAYAYNKLGENEKAKAILRSVDDSKVGYDTLKFQSISVFVHRDIGDYKQAFSVYWNFSKRLDSINVLRFEQKSKSIAEKHRIELMAKEDARKKDKIIWTCIGGIAFFVMLAFILYLLARSSRVKKDLAVQKAKAAQFENENLKSESERLSLENRNLQLERDNKTLEVENLAHRVETLENESESLKNLLETADEIPSEVQQAIRIRIEMLNSLLASYITDNDQYGKPYDIWVRELTENTDEFMNSNRMAFQVSHPRFIQYFEEHGLTPDEINYVCLYAIGLRGKEVGNYMKKRSHVNISSAIRKKLGIDKHETNIGIYVRKLLKNLR